MVILPKKHSIDDFNAYCPLFAPTSSRNGFLTIPKKEKRIQKLRKTAK
jgi:hypothetical protein